MDPINSSFQPINTVNATPVNAAPTGPAPEKIGNPVPKTDKKFLVYGIVMGLVVVVILGVAGFYLMYRPQNNNEIADVQNQVVEEDVEPTPAEISQIQNASELDNLIVGLAQADGELDKELVALQKDSNF